MAVPGRSATESIESNGFFLPGLRYGWAWRVTRGLSYIANSCHGDIAGLHDGV